MHSISPLSFTALEFADLISKKLGKGKEHALILYHDWYQTMIAGSSNPAFLNAGALLEQVLAAYVLIKDVNDREEDSLRLAAYLEGLDVKVNLIPYNAQSHDRFQSPENGQVDQFKKLLMAHGYQVLVRKSRGEKIMAACGQLGTNVKFRERSRGV